MDSKSVEIIVQVVFKAHMEQASKTELGSLGVNFDAIKSDTEQLIKIITELGSKVSVPFVSRPAEAKRGEKFVGMPCPDCQTPMIQGKKGVYCRACYIKWAEANKKA